MYRDINQRADRGMKKLKPDNRIYTEHWYAWYPVRAWDPVLEKKVWVWGEMVRRDINFASEMYMGLFPTVTFTRLK